MSVVLISCHHVQSVCIYLCVFITNSSIHIYITRSVYKIYEKVLFILPEERLPGKGFDWLFVCLFFSFGYIQLFVFRAVKSKRFVIFIHLFFMLFRKNPVTAPFRFMEFWSLVLCHHFSFSHYFDYKFLRLVFNPIVIRFGQFCDWEISNC